MPGQDRRILSPVHASVNRMQNAIALSGMRLRMDEKRAAEKAFARLAESHAYRIVHATRHDDFQLAAIRAGSKHMRRPRLMQLSISQEKALLQVNALGPIEIAVRTQIRAVHIIAAFFNGTAVKPRRPLIGHMIPIRIAEFPNMRRGAYIDVPFMNEDAFRKGHVFGEYRRFIEDSVAVLIDETQNTVAWLRELKRRWPAVPGTVRDVQGALVIEIHVHRPLNEPGGRGELQLVAIQQGEGMRRKGLVFSPSGEQRKYASGQNQSDD